MAQDWFAQNAPKSTAPSGGDDWFAANAPKQDFTANTKGEGTYKMAGPGGKSVPVPYSMVGDASKAGYTMTDEDRGRYVKDASADPNLNEGKNLPSGVKVIGKNSAGQDIYGPKGTVEGGAGERFLHSAVSALKDAAKGMQQADMAMQPHTPMQWATAAIAGPAEAVYPLLVKPQVEQGKQAYEAAKDASESGRGTDVSRAVGHAAAAVTPFVGPWAAQVGEQVGGQIGSGDYAGAVGTVAGNAVLYAAPKALGKVAEGVKAIPDSIRDRVGNQEVKKLVKETEKENKTEEGKVATENAAADEKHLGDTLDALQKTREAEDIHSHEEKARREKLDEENRKAKEEHDASELQRIEKEGNDRLEALEKNKKNEKDYDKKKAALKEQNEENLRLEKSRQDVQSRLDTASQDLDEKYDSAFKKARGEYNDTWNKWRGQVKGATADMTSTVDTIRGLEKSMEPNQVAQFRQILKADDAAHASVELRDEYANQAFGSDYEKLNDNQRAVIDKDLDERGLDPESGAASPVPAERLHTWKSQLEQAVRNTSDGTVRYAVGKVLDQLRKAEEDVSASVGPEAVSQLAKARAITGPYFDAFFKSPTDIPRAATQSLREQTPEYIKERNQQERLDRIAAYDPTIKTTANLVANLREALTKIAKPGEYKNYPPEPTAVDVPSKPTAATPFEPKPFEQKPAPARTEVPNRPAEQKVNYKEISPEDATNAKKTSLAKTADWLRHRANWIASGLTISRLPFDMLHGKMTAAADDVLMSGVAYYITGKLGDFIENPKVADWLTKPTAKDLNEIMKLPPEQRASLAKTWGPIIDKANTEGIKVNPKLSAAIAGGVASQKKSLDDLKKDAADRKPNANSAAPVKQSPQDLMDQAKKLKDSFAASGYATTP